MSTTATCFTVCITLLLWRSRICGGVVSLPPTVVNATTEGGCPPSGVLDEARDSHLDAVRLALRESVLPILCPDCPPCVCGGQGEWVSVARLNFTDTTVDCPPNWSLVTSPVRGCGRSTIVDSCDSASISSGGRSYSRVCGQVIGIQGGIPIGFFNNIIRQFADLEGPYISGVSLTHGAAGSRQHIWSFVTARYEEDASYDARVNCACTDTDRDWPYQTPTFVGDDYFCATGNPGPISSGSAIYSENPLWDGEGCGPTNACCQFNNPPYFCTTLPQATTDDLELRMCQGFTAEFQIVTLVDLYIM